MTKPHQGLDIEVLGDKDSKASPNVIIIIIIITIMWGH
jgi:hypothetical protein